MVTPVTEIKLVPVIVTRFPICCRTGLKLLMVGAARKVKATDWLLLPPGVVTTTFPVAPEPTVAVIWVGLFTVNEVTAVPPSVTAVAAVNPEPVITTGCPAPVVVGEMLLTLGTAFLMIKNRSLVLSNPLRPRRVN